MAKIQTRNKQNPKLQQSELKDGRASLYLEYYLGRTESPVLDEDGNQVFYTTGAMAGKPKFKVKHDRRKENLNLYIWLHPKTKRKEYRIKTLWHSPRRYVLNVSRRFLKTVPDTG